MVGETEKDAPESSPQTGVDFGVSRVYRQHFIKSRSANSSRNDISPYDCCIASHELDLELQALASNVAIDRGAEEVGINERGVVDTS